MRYFRNFVVSCHVALLLNLWLAPVQAQTIQQLYGFGCDSKSNVCSEGKIPNSLFQSTDGNFYGTTFGGGVGNNASGTVFQITAAGQLTTLFTFVADQHGNFSDGEFPTSLVEGNDFQNGTCRLAARIELEDSSRRKVSTKIGRTIVRAIGSYLNPSTV